MKYRHLQRLSLKIHNRECLYIYLDFLSLQHIFEFLNIKLIHPWLKLVLLDTTVNGINFFSF